MDKNYSGLIARPYNGTGPAIERAQADKRNTQYPVGALTPFVLNLDNAQALTEYRFAGDSIYLDRRSTGQIRFRLDMAWPAAFPLGANDGLRNLPYKQLLLEWDAQPGLVAYLWTGYGVDLSLSVGAITTIGSITNPVTVSAINSPLSTYQYSTSYKSNAPLAASTPETIVAPGSNLNGIDFFHGSYFHQNGAGLARGVFTAKATPPATTLDGDIFLDTVAQQIQAAIWSGQKTLQRPIRISANLGAYAINSVAEGAGLRSALYTLK